MKATESYKDYRKYLILNLINHFQPISRTRLVELTNFQPASVTALVKELLEQNYVVETGKHSNNYGRKRVLLEINKSQFRTILVTLDADRISYYVVQFDGTVLKTERVPFDPDCGRDRLVRLIAENAARLTGEFSDGVIAGVGLCDPFYDSQTYLQGDPLFPSYDQTLTWVANELKSAMESVIRRPVRLFSPVTLPALSEKRYGAAKDCDSFICVELSNGIGCSYCLNGTVVSGNNGVAGEIGHLVVNAGDGEDRICYCGKAGCLEAYASFPVIVRDIENALDRGVYSRLQAVRESGGALTAKVIGRAVSEHDQLATHYVRKSAELIGIAIANAVNLMNPKLVILFGFMLDLGNFFLRELEASVRANVLPISSDFEIRLSQSLGQYLPFGAADEVFSDFFHMEDFKWIYKMSAEPETAGGKEKRTEGTGT